MNTIGLNLDRSLFLKFKISVLCLLFVFVFSFRVGANVAPPGFWGAGHGSTLIPVFKEDSLAISWLQMEKEWIEIDLYRNYAVVKGTYWFKNHADQVLKLRMGYPINGSHPATAVEEVRFDDLYHLQVFINGKPIEIQTLSDLVNAQNAEGSLVSSSLQKWEDWYVWQVESTPLEQMKVEVYFIVKTNATLIKGYGRKEGNAFEYILHTGASWRNRILSGEIEVQLKEGLTVDDMYGVNPGKLYYLDNWIFYTFSNLEPNRSDDLIFWYDGNHSEFEGDFPSDSLYKVLDSRDASLVKAKGLNALEKKDFDTPAPEFVYIIIGVFILFSSCIVGIVVLIILFIKNRKKRL